MSNRKKSAAEKEAQLLAEAQAAQEPTGPPPPPPSVLDILLDAVRHGDAETVATHLTRHNCNFADRTHQLTLLMWAVEAGEITIAEMLLKSGAQQHLTDPTGFTALHRAAHRNKSNGEGMVKLLLSFDRSPQNVNAQSAGSRRTPLILGAMQGSEGVVAALVVQGRANVDIRDSAGMSAIDHAAFRGYESIVKLLAAHGAACNAALYFAGDGERHALTGEQRAQFEGLVRYLYSPWSQQSVVTP